MKATFNRGMYLVTKHGIVIVNYTVVVTVTFEFFSLHIVRGAYFNHLKIRLTQPMVNLYIDSWARKNTV